MAKHRRAEWLAFLHFKTAKYVVVRDWRLGFLHKSCYIFGFLYFLIWRCGYYGSHFSRVPVQTDITVDIHDGMSDTQYNFEPRPPSCVASEDKTRSYKHPKDYVYELLDAGDMFHQITVGEYFIPTRLEPWSTSHDPMQRTYSEGYSSAVCTAACTLTNLTLNENASLRQCSSRNTESACLSSYITQSNGRLMRRCVWQAGTSECSIEPYSAECPAPCGSGCDPCWRFCDREFVNLCNGGKPDEATCNTLYTYQAGSDEEIGTAMLCRWKNGVCAPFSRSRMECLGLESQAAQRKYCNRNVTEEKALKKKDCNIYKSPVQYKPKVRTSYFREGLGQRMVGAPERLILQFKHVLFTPKFLPSSGNMRGFLKDSTVTNSWIDMETESDSTLDDTVCESRRDKTSWTTCVGENCVGEKHFRVVNWERDGRAKRCHPYADQTVDFIPLSVLLDLANVTMDCNDPLGRMYASPLDGFSLIVDFRYRNRRTWDWRSSNFYTTMTVKYDALKGTLPEIQLSSTTLEKFYGSSVFSNGIRIVVRGDARISAVSGDRISLLIPEFFAFLAILESTIVLLFAVHATATRFFNVGSPYSRLASTWFTKYLFERTPNIAKILKLTRRLRKVESPIVLNSHDEIGLAGVELDEYAYITKIEEHGLTYKLVQAWNKEHPVRSIGIGDQILEVNGKTSAQEMDIELKLRNAFIIKVGLHRKYPAVLSDAAMSAISGGTSHERLFDTTSRNMLTSTDMKRQLAMFTQAALRELDFNHISAVTSTSTGGGEQNFQNALSKQDSTLHVLDKIASTPLHGYSSTHNVWEVTTAEKKISSMEDAIQELSMQVEDLLRWKAGLLDHQVPAVSKFVPSFSREYSRQALDSPKAESTPMNKAIRRGVDGVLIGGNGAEAAELNERVLRLERILGQLHEPAEEEHHALKFDVLLQRDISDFDAAQESDCAQLFARHLGCDRVDILKTGNNKKALSLLAIGFVDMEHATQAGEKLMSDGLEEYPVLGNIENIKMSHRASYWLQFRRHIERCIRLEAKNIARLASMNWQIVWQRLEAMEKSYFFDHDKEDRLI